VEIIEFLAEDIPYTLLEMYEAPGEMSLVRHTAADEMWTLPGFDHSDPAQATPTDAESETVSASVPEAVPLPLTVGPAETLAALLRPPRPRTPDSSEVEVEVGGPDRTPGAPYRLPSHAELRRLLGVDAAGELDRDDLLPAASWFALVLDRLVALGAVRRAADRADLTPMGRIMVRSGFILAGGAAPTLRAVAEATPRRLLEHLLSWSRHTRLDALNTWLGGRDESAWRELLATAAAGPRSLRGFFELLGVWSYVNPERLSAGVKADRPELPCPLEEPEAEKALQAALHQAVDDPITGAYAAEALRLRGQVPAEPPLRSVAVLLLDRLAHLTRVDDLEDGDGGDGGDAGDARPEARHGSSLCATFDEAAADWPGGADDLLRLFGETVAALGGPAQTGIDVIEMLSEAHPQPAVARAARTVLRHLQLLRERTSTPPARRRASGGRRPPKGRSASSRKDRR
jgi:hypothetical protein